MKTRYKALHINAEMIPIIFNGIDLSKIEPLQTLPDGVRIVNARLGFPDVLELILSHDSWEINEPDKPIPFLEMQYKRKE